MQEEKHTGTGLPCSIGAISADSTQEKHRYVHFTEEKTKVQLIGPASECEGGGDGIWKLFAPKTSSLPLGHSVVLFELKYKPGKQIPTKYLPSKHLEAVARGMALP